MNNNLLEHEHRREHMDASFSSILIGTCAGACASVHACRRCTPTHIAYFAQRTATHGCACGCIHAQVGASNELPESEELDALYDRFLLRRHVSRVSNANVHQLARLASGRGMTLDAADEERKAAAAAGQGLTLQVRLEPRVGCKRSPMLGH